MQAKRRRGLAALFALAALALFVAGCGGSDDNGGGNASSASSSPSSSASAQPGKGKPPITIGTKDFTEEFVLGELYKQALEAKGYTVNLKRNIGPTEITDKALTSKQIDAYPEYTGITTAVVAKDDELSPSKEDTAQKAKDFYEKRGQTVIGPTPFQDVDAVAAPRALAGQNTLKAGADRKTLLRFSIGARPEFKSPLAGLVGMKKQYGIHHAQYNQVCLGL